MQMSVYLNLVPIHPIHKTRLANDPVTNWLEPPTGSIIWLLFTSLRPYDDDKNRLTQIKTFIEIMIDYGLGYKISYTIINFELTVLQNLIF